MLTTKIEVCIIIIIHEIWGKFPVHKQTDRQTAQMGHNLVYCLSPLILCIYRFINIFVLFFFLNIKKKNDNTFSFEIDYDWNACCVTIRTTKCSTSLLPFVIHRLASIVVTFVQLSVNALSSWNIFGGRRLNFFALLQMLLFIIRLECVRC